jgi:hypothetical protein
MAARDLSSHEVYVVIEGHRQQEVGISHPGLALHINIDAVALYEFDTLQLGCAPQPTGFLIYDSDFVPSFQKRCDCS